MWSAKKPALCWDNKLHCIDMGIALWHIARESDDFHFSKETNMPERKGHIYMGTAK